MSEKSEISSEELPAAAAKPVKRKLLVLDPAVRLPPNHEEASVCSVSCLNMTFLVNEARISKEPNMYSAADMLCVRNGE